MKKLDGIEFARNVRAIVMEIPVGKVSTYGDIAALAGEPTQSRLVGRILGAIGRETEVPCHRVVNFQGRPAPHWPSQVQLLRGEGVRFRPGGFVDMRLHRWHPEAPE